MLTCHAGRGEFYRGRMIPSIERPVVAFLAALGAGEQQADDR